MRYREAEAPSQLASRAIYRRVLVSQTVKDVLQGLVDDGLVCAEKIGASNCERVSRLGVVLFGRETFDAMLTSVSHLASNQSTGAFRLRTGLW